MTKYREIDMDFTIFGSCLIKKIGAMFVLFSTLTSVVLFQNLGNLKSNTSKILVLVLQKLSLFDSSFSDSLFNSMIFNVLYLEK